MIREDVCYMFCLPKTFINNSERFAWVSCAEYVRQSDYKAELLVRMLCVREERPLLVQGSAEKTHISSATISYSTVSNVTKICITVVYTKLLTIRLKF